MKFALIVLGFLFKKCFALPSSPNCIQPPMECPNDNITYWLYTRETQNDPHQLNMSDLSTINSAPFIPNVQTIILIHGYTGWKDFAPNPEIRPAYFEYGQFNIISPDYNPLVREPCYREAASNVPLIGKCTAQLLDYLILERNMSIADFHVIGFSLGAQVSGELSNWMEGGKLPRITGLDPAMPLFVTTDRKKKLDKTDADFVDVIHTNALRRGKLEPSGHVDFYVNGGSYQPGCENNDQNMTEGSCSHWRAPVYYGESINSKRGFYARHCPSWFLYQLGLCWMIESSEEVVMGMHTPKDTEGLYFLETNSKAPYARGKQGKSDEKQAKGNLNEEDDDQPDLANITDIESELEASKEDIFSIGSNEAPTVYN